jgi:hypothetical protein
MRLIDNEGLLQTVCELRKRIVNEGEVRPVTTVIEEEIWPVFNGQDYRRELTVGETHYSKYTSLCKGRLMSAISGETWRVVILLSASDCHFPHVTDSNGWKYCVFLNGDEDDLVRDMVEYRLRCGGGPI